MKKIFCFILILNILFLSSCTANKVLSEGQLLYDCGAESSADVQKYEFIYEGYDEYNGDNQLVITDESDQALFSHYEYVSDWPSEQLHELYLFPSNTFTITVNDQAFTFYLSEDGSLTSVPSANVSGRKTYQAEKKYRITEDKLNELIAKYDK